MNSKKDWIKSQITAVVEEEALRRANTEPSEYSGMGEQPESLGEVGGQEQNILDSPSDERKRRKEARAKRKRERRERKEKKKKKHDKKRRTGHSESVRYQQDEEESRQVGEATSAKLADEMVTEGVPLSPLHSENEGKEPKEEDFFDAVLDRMKHRRKRKRQEVNEDLLDSNVHMFGLI